jgi:hypothetical protein
LLLLLLYGLIARPLNNLLKKKQFGWNAEAQAAFEKLKVAMSTTPVLALPDFSKPFVVETDASDLGFGAVLMQEDRPLAFISKPLSNTNKSLSIYEKEFMALILAVEKWRQYLQREEFVIKTDHRSLAYLNDQVLQSDLQRKAMTKLMGLQFKILYRKGKENLAADALSRVAPMMTIQACSEVRPLWVQEIVNSYATDIRAQELLAQLAISSPNEQGYSLQEGIIRVGSQIWVGHNSALRTRLINVFHSFVLGVILGPRQPIIESRSCFNGMV